MVCSAVLAADTFPRAALITIYEFLAGRRTISRAGSSGPRIAGDNNFHGGASTRVVTITVQRNVHGTVTGAIHGYWLVYTVAGRRERLRYSVHNPRGLVPRRGVHIGTHKHRYYVCIHINIHIYTYSRRMYVSLRSCVYSTLRYSEGPKATLRNNNVNLPGAARNRLNSIM